MRSGVSVRTIIYLESGQTRRPYQRTVQLLADTLGLENSVRGQFEHAARPLIPRAVVSLQGSADRDEAVDGPELPAVPTPAQLPHDVRDFVGRETEMTTMTELHEKSAGILLIAVIEGAAGVGKTALAVHWGHQFADRFPSGQLYVNLRGFDPKYEPVSSAQAIDTFLDAFATPAERERLSLDARISLYRSLLSGRQMLIVLDNARDEEQVRPLLPGNSGCMVIVTSRQQLGGLVAADGARTLTLDVLSDLDAYDLLAQRIDKERIEAEPQAVGSIIRFSAKLPLALTAIATQAADRPCLSLIAEELRHITGRLDALDTGDALTSVREAFSWTYQSLSPPAARLFWLLGLHPGPDIGEAAAASLADISHDEAGRLLRHLVRCSLLREHDAGRFTFHELLRAYACDLVNRGSATEREAALGRISDYYLNTAATAISAGTLTIGAAWLDIERANLVAIACATARDRPSYTIKLAETLFPYVVASGYFSEAVSIYQHARLAASRLGNRFAEATALTNLGVVALCQGRDQQATNYIGQALNLLRDPDDPAGRALALHNLGIVETLRSKDPEAANHLRKSLQLFRSLGPAAAGAR